MWRLFGGAGDEAAVPTGAAPADTGRARAARRAGGSSCRGGWTPNPPAGARSDEGRGTAGARGPADSSRGIADGGRDALAPGHPGQHPPSPGGGRAAGDRHSRPRRTLGLAHAIDPEAPLPTRMDRQARHVAAPRRPDTAPVGRTGHQAWQRGGAIGGTRQSGSAPHVSRCMSMDATWRPPGPLSRTSMQPLGSALARRADGLRRTSAGHGRSTSRSSPFPLQRVEALPFLAARGRVRRPSSRPSRTMHPHGACAVQPIFPPGELTAPRRRPPGAVLPQPADPSFPKLGRMPVRRPLSPFPSFRRLKVRSLRRTRRGPGRQGSPRRPSQVSRQ